MLISGTVREVYDDTNTLYLYLDRNVILPTQSYSQSNVVILSETGCKAYGYVSRGLFVPTLTLVAVKHIDLPDILRGGTSTSIADMSSLLPFKVPKTSYICPHLLLDSMRDSDQAADSNFVSMGSPSRCPYIIGSYGAYTDEDNNTLDLVQEHMNAGSIQNKINEKIIFSENDAAVLAYSVLRALKTLHEHGIVHHEVRPSKMLLNTKGCIKLTSFGLSPGQLLVYR